MIPGDHILLQELEPGIYKLVEGNPNKEKLLVRMYSDEFERQEKKGYLVEITALHIPAKTKKNAI